MQKRGHRDSPARIGCADDVGLGNLHIVEENLVELGVPGYLHQRPNLDAVGVHVDQQVSDAFVLRRVRIGANNENAEIGDVSEARPHLLSVNDVVIAGIFSSCSQRGQIAARPGLGESLAPDLLAGKDRREVCGLLLVCSVGDDRRTSHAEPDDADVLRSLGSRALLEEDGLVRVGGALAPVLLGPGQTRVPRVVESLRPLARDGFVHPPAARGPFAPSLGEVVRDPGPQLLAKGRLFWSVSEVHRQRSLVGRGRAISGPAS